MAKTNRSKKSATPKANGELRHSILHTDIDLGALDATIEALTASLEPLYEKLTTENEYLVTTIEALVERAQRQVNEAMVDLEAVRKCVPAAGGANA